jgi:2-polyprenyl-6-methoxyphenol hydroxylase-like FAD-dependent oxidoreductase
MTATQDQLCPVGYDRPRRPCAGAKTSISAFEIGQHLFPRCGNFRYTRFKQGAHAGASRPHHQALNFGGDGMGRINKVLIVGGGIGGLASAIALRKQGIEVELIEISKTLTAYHIGIVVQANFIRAAQALGIADRIVAAGYPYNGLNFQDIHGNLIQRLPGYHLAGENYSTHLGMARPALHKVLSEAALEAGTKVRTGLTFSAIEQGPDQVDVSFTDGSRGVYDLVIGADGIYSHVRKALFGDRYTPEFTGQGVWRYNVPRPKEVTSSFVAMGLEKGKCGFIPLSEETGYVWLVQEELGNPRHPEDQLAEIFRQRLAPCTGVMAWFREHITDSTKVVYRPLEALLLPAPWYRGRVLLIGDAAHATTPHMGQGSAQAVEDAVVLAELLALDQPVDTTMEQFMTRRFERCKFIVESSLQIGEWEQRPTDDADAPGLTARMLDIMAQPI